MDRSSGAADGFKDIRDPHERRKAQNRIAQRRRRQRLRQDTETFGVDVVELAGYNTIDLSLLGGEQDFGLDGAPGWTQGSMQDSTLETDSAFMDFVIPEAFELKDATGVYSSTECSPEVVVNRSMHQRVMGSTSDPCRHRISHPGRSVMTHPLKRGSREPHQGDSRRSDSRNLGGCQHGPCDEISPTNRYDSGFQSRGLSSNVPIEGVRGDIHTADPHHGSSPSPKHKRIRPEFHHHNRHHHPAARNLPLSSTSSCRFSASRETDSQSHDDWETQQSRIASTLTRKLKKLATDMTRLYELGVYLDIHFPDAELEDLLSELKKKFTVQGDRAENLTRLAADRTDEFGARQTDSLNKDKCALGSPDF